MNEHRAKQLLKNVLADVCKTSEMPQSQYMDWLALEVGMTEDEMVELDVASLFFFPDFSETT